MVKDGDEPAPGGVPRRAVLASALGALWALGCEDGAGAGPVARADAVPGDAAPRDGAATGEAGLDGDVGLDGGPPDAGSDAAEDEATARVRTFVRGPWVQLGAVGEARLRLETFAGAAGVSLRVNGAPLTLTVTEAEVRWQWPPRPTTPEADHAGRYAVHEVWLRDLAPGSVHTWEVRGGFGTRAGRFRVPPAEGPLRIAWISDTMWPNSERVAAVLAPLAPDLVLHGGDIQYRSNPGDTYTTFFRIWRPLLEQAPMNLCVGNHESDSPEEFGDFFARLFRGQGEVGPGEDPHVVHAGPLRVLMLDSEEQGFGAGGDAQVAWLEAQLARFAEDATVRQVVVAFHRPYFTFSRAGPNRTARERLHPIFRAAGVKLVLTGHNHCYERFVVDGIEYIVDGGAGALSYDPDQRLEDIRANHPEEEALRRLASREHGALVLDLSPDGTIRVRRVDWEGGETDAFTVTPWR